MAWDRTKTNHRGPKRGKGHWGRKAEAKAASKRSRRREDRLFSDPATEGEAIAGVQEFVLEPSQRTLEDSEW